tara:strand:+ start:1651 stop:1902 length:252 start_codon:yes stop_codon:yes gene_type:complete
MIKLFFCLLGIAFFYKALTGVDVLSKGGAISLIVLFLKFIAIYCLFLLILFVVIFLFKMFVERKLKKKESLSSLYRKATKKIK